MQYGAISKDAARLFHVREDTHKKKIIFLVLEPLRSGSGLVWYSLVWYGMVWYGLVWYGMVWYGLDR